MGIINTPCLKLSNLPILLRLLKPLPRRRKNLNLKKKMKKTPSSRR